MGVMNEPEDRTRQNEVMRGLLQRVPEDIRELAPILPWGKLTDVERAYVIAANLDELASIFSELMADWDDEWLKEEGKDAEGYSAGLKIHMIRECVAGGAFSLRLLAAEMEGTPREDVPYGRHGYPMVISPVKEGTGG